jgi:hypothetical protein
LALAGLLLVLAAIAAWPRLQEHLDRTLPARVAARAVARALEKHPATVGPVLVSGAEIQLVEKGIRLVVSEPDAKAGEPMGHFHVLTRLADAPLASLDACIIGGGDSPETRIESVGEAFADIAFPPLLSRSRGQPMLSSRLFWGDEAWGVPRMHGYVGPVLGRGSADGSEFLEAPLFADIPDLPRDGKLHLLKAVLYGEGGHWLRTVELDGGETQVSRKRFAPLEPQADPGVIVRYAVYDGPPEPATASGRDHVLERLKAREPWLFTSGDCPADLVPALLPSFAYSPGACRGDRLLECVRDCQRGAASFCYAAALELQPTNLDPDAVQAFFLRSCRLGFPSGCTNAAAGRIKGGEMDACSLGTFDAICERAGDPWACTMLGAALAKGEATPRDAARARTVLDKACQHDQRDPACRAARSVADTLEEPEASATAAR